MPFNGTKSRKSLPQLDDQYKSLVKLNLEIICDLKFEIVACGAKIKQSDFPDISTTKIDATNLVDLNIMLKRKLGCWNLTIFTQG